MEWEKLGSITVLIADDDAFNRQLIISLLSKIPSIKYIEADNGIEALDYLEREKIDIILLDLHMPKLNGIETIKEIKKSETLALIPIIVISTDEMVMREFFELGANDFISKPFKLQELQAKIYKYIQKFYYAKEAQKKKKSKEKEREESIKDDEDSQDSKVEVVEQERLFSLEEIENSQKEMFKGLAYIISLRDKNIKVSAKLVKAFAELLNYNRNDIDRLYLSTIVYNIGALSSDNFKKSYTDILSNKNNSIERVYMFQAYKIIKNSIETPFLKILKHVIVEHKENYNGTGAPQGLKGKKISSYAQIVHIVETFNILLDRQNSPKNIYNFFIKQSGEMFDPDILYNFLEYFDYFVQLREKYIKED
jgi:putative two-component system response regulator